MQVSHKGKQITGGELLAQLLWEIAMTGKATFPDETELQVSVRDWLETVKWLYAQIDGPPPKPEPDEPEDDELTDEDLEAMSDEELEAYVASRQKRKGAGRKRHSK